MFRSYLLLAACACLSLSACGPSGGVASASAVPAPAASPPPTSVIVAGAVADATLPPISAVLPTANTTIDDATIAVAWDALDTAAAAADTLLGFVPSLAGSAAGKNLADKLEGASTWLTVASTAQKASQARTYTDALAKAQAALAGAKSALAALVSGKK